MSSRDPFSSYPWNSRAAGCGGRYTSGPWNALAGATLIDGKRSSSLTCSGEAHKARMPMPTPVHEPDPPATACSMGAIAWGDPAAGSLGPQLHCSEPQRAQGICGLQGSVKGKHLRCWRRIYRLSPFGGRGLLGGLAGDVRNAERVTSPDWGTMAVICRSSSDLSAASPLPYLADVGATGVAGTGLQRCRLRGHGPDGLARWRPWQWERLRVQCSSSGADAIPTSCA